MKTLTYASIFIFVVCLLFPSAATAGGKNYMGGHSKLTAAAEEEPTTTDGGSGNWPDSIDGPLNDKMADAGKLFGDLYKLLRQNGLAGDQKLVPKVDLDGNPVYSVGTFVYDFSGQVEIGDGTYTYDVDFIQDVQLFEMAENTTLTPDAVVGGEPVLTVIDTGQMNSVFSDYGWYAAEIAEIVIGEGEEDIAVIYGAVQSPFPAQCVQPVASYERWGNIFDKTGLTKNRLPMIITYDATWNRSECEVGELVGTPTADPLTGAIDWEDPDLVNPYFIKPCDVDEFGEYDDVTQCQWEDPVNGVVTYPYGVLWTALIGEVHFGRLNLSRSPEAVLQASFDEAVNNLNSEDTIAIEIDAAGRILLTKKVYSELEVEPDTGEPVLIGTVKKAIDSPLENMSLYVKLVKDGHLVTPGDEREPIDRSLYGGIPIWKLLGLEDGPADAALRPTIDIEKMREWGMGNLVDVEDYNYWTYYECLKQNGSVADTCLCWNDDPMQPELLGEWVACDSVVERVLRTSTDPECEVHVADTDCIVCDNIDVECPDGQPIGEEGCHENVPCDGPFLGIETDDPAYAPDADSDFPYAAAFLAAAADKTGEIGVDMVVYINSILGINQVVGKSEDGTVDYEANPVYFNFRGPSAYNRHDTFSQRGNRKDPEVPSEYNGQVTVLQGAKPTWTETDVFIMYAERDGNGIPGDGQKIFDDIGIDTGTTFPNGSIAEYNILGFTQQADDDLSVIKFVHTFQIPGLR